MAGTLADAVYFDFAWCVIFNKVSAESDSFVQRGFRLALRGYGVLFVDYSEILLQTVRTMLTVSSSRRRRPMKDATTPRVSIGKSRTLCSIPGSACLLDGTKSEQC